MAKIFGIVITTFVLAYSSWRDRQGNVQTKVSKRPSNMGGWNPF
jgi:hypothetical protein